RRLIHAAPGWRTKATSTQFANRTAIRDIMIDCTAFLSAAAVISKMLFSGGRRNTKIVRRCERLRQLLGIRQHDLPLLRNLAIRNAFEHVDERLDSLLE